MAIGGSISAYRTPDLIREFRKRGAHVIPIVSNAASKIIGIEAIQWAADEKPITELTGEMEHINLFQNENEIPVLLVCPARVNIESDPEKSKSDIIAPPFTISPALIMVSFRCAFSFILPRSASSKQKNTTQCAVFYKRQPHSY